MAKQGTKIRLTRKALILGKPETTYGVDSLPVPATDAALANEPDYSIDPTVLERNFVRNDISPLGTRIGRKIASLAFGLELKSNGATQSGSVNDAAILGTFLRGCGYSETGMTGNGTVSAITDAAGNTVDPTWATAGTNTATNINDYRISVVLGGASATAELRVTGGQAGRDATVLPRHDVTAEVYRLDGVTTTVTAVVDESDPLAVDITIGGVFLVGDIVRACVNGVLYEHAVITGDTDLDGIATAVAALIDVHALIIAGTTLAVVNITYTGAGAGTVTTSATTAQNLGDTGMDLTPTWAGSLVLGDSWEVTVNPTGVRYDPVSDNFESMSMYGYFDGLLHKVLGSYGTFSIEATAGEFATVTFTFTGLYSAPIDQDVPDGTFETTLPPIVELAQLIIGDFQPVVAAFTFDQNNTIVPRPDVSSADGFIGVRITERDPQGGIDPESTLSVDKDFWTELADSTEFKLNIKIGQDAGNRVAIAAPKVQYTGLTYGDRDGLSTYDAGLRFARNTGNDEISIVMY